MSEKSFEHYHFESIEWKKTKFMLNIWCILHLFSAWKDFFFSQTITGPNKGCLLCVSLNILPTFPVKGIGFRFCFSLMQVSILRRKILHIPAYPLFGLVHETFAQVLKSVHHANLFVSQDCNFHNPWHCPY